MKTGHLTVVAVLYGGISAEREVSMSSGLQVISGLRQAGYEVRPVEVGRDLGAVIAALDPAPDVVFNALHGRYGEDGVIQGVMDWMGLCYTHSPARASALAMDKVAARAIFEEAGLPIAEGMLVDRAALALSDPLPPPYVIKPVCEGSSVGVHILRAGDNRREEIAAGWAFGSQALVEAYIPGRELTVGVLGDRALAVTEIDASHEFYDYDSKYAAGGSRHLVPAPVPQGDRRLRLPDRAGGASGAGLPGREPGRLPLRRHGERAGAAGAAGGEHPAGPDADIAAAGAGGVLRDRFSAALRVDGGARRMPRVTGKPPKPSGQMPPRKPAGRARAEPPTLGQPRHLTDRPHRWRLALRRHRRRLRPALYGLACLTLLIVGAALTHANSHAASLTSLRQRFGALGAAFGLRVDRVIVQGRSTTPEPLLDAAIGIAPGDPLLGFSVEAARGRIATLASVQDATVERHWPSTILVSLTERHPFAVWQNQGRFALIDRDGSVLADQDVGRAGRLPLVVGLGAPAHAAALLDALAGHTDIDAHLVAAVRVGDRRWNLRLTSGADVLLPDERLDADTYDQNAALDRLSMLQQSHQVLDRKLQVIDLRLPDRITLRPDVAMAPVPGSPPAPPAPLPSPSTHTAVPALPPVARSPREPT